MILEQFWSDDASPLFQFNRRKRSPGSFLLMFPAVYCVDLLIQHLTLKAFHNKSFFKISLYLWFDSIESLSISWIFFTSFSVSTVGSVLTSGSQFCWHSSHESPFHHSVGILSTLQPRLPISAGLRSVGTCRQLIKSFSRILLTNREYFISLRIVCRFLFPFPHVKQLNCQSIHKTFWLAALPKNLWYFYIDLLPYTLPQVPVLV